MHVNLEMVGDNFSKVHYNNLQGPPDPGRGWPLPLFGPLLWGFFLGPDQMAKLSKAFFMRKICRQEWSSIFLSLCEELASEKRKHIAQNIRPQRPQGPNLTNPPHPHRCTRRLQEFYWQHIRSWPLFRDNNEKCRSIWADRKRSAFPPPLCCEHCFTHDSHMTCTFCPGSKGLQMLTENRDNLLSGHNTL